MKVKFKKLGPEAKIPKKAHETDAGFDLVATSRRMDRLGYIEYGTSLAIAIPEGYVGLIFPRSSISNVKLTLTNSVGVVDSGYQGEIRFRFKVTITGNKLYEVGDKVGQLIIMPIHEIEFEEVEDFDNSERGDGGFGSTGE